MSRFFSCSSLSNYFTLGVPILGLLVTLYIGALSLIRPSIANLLSSFCSCYIIILYLNLSIVSYFLRLIARFLKLLYFLILVLTF